MEEKSKEAKFNNFDFDIGTQDDWGEEGIFNPFRDQNNEDKDEWDGDVNIVTQNDWKDEEYFISFRDQIYEDEDVWNDDVNTVTEVLSNFEQVDSGDARSRV
eukprot:8300292-Ditylum_brightwellii.AAC.1